MKLKYKWLRVKKITNQHALMWLITYRPCARI